MMKYIALVFLLIAACTSEPEHLPEESKYAEDANLLVRTTEKLADEPDAKKLHDVALALQQTRTLACINFNDECNLYGSFLSLAIRVSKKGEVSKDDRKSLLSKAADLRVAVEEGKIKLSAAWAKRKKKS